MVNEPLFFHWRPFLFPFFSHSIFMFDPPNFQCNPLVVFFLRYDPYYFIIIIIIIILFKIIYKIEIYFYFHHLSIFFICQIGSHSFDCYFFYFRWFLKLFFFTIPSSFSFISYQIWSLFFWLLFFYFDKFFKLIFFSISSSNIKLNWASWLNSSLRFQWVIGLRD